jgi:hypothetical protein
MNPSIERNIGAKYSSIPLQSLSILPELATNSITKSNSVELVALDIYLYEYLSKQPLNSLIASDRPEYCSLLVPGANGLGNLFEHICDRSKRVHKILALPENPFTALRMAKSVVRRLSPQKAIHIIAHSNGNLNIAPFLVASLRTLAKTMNRDPIPIKVCRLDPIGIPKSTVIGAAQVIDIGSNKPDSRDPRDRAALSFLRPDFRARQGIGHSDLLNDTEIFDRLTGSPYNFF